MVALNNARQTRHSPWRQFVLQAETGTFVAAWLLFLVIGRSRFFRDPGTFWHTVVGERMLSRGELVWSDPFSFTFAGHPWIAHQWLGEVGMAMLHRLGGLDALLVNAAALLAWLVTWIGARARRQGLHWVRASALSTVVGALLMSHVHIRPQLITVGAQAVLVALVLDYEAGRASWRRLGGLVPLCAVWTNVHGGILGGLGSLGLIAGGWLLCSAGLPIATSKMGKARLGAALVVMALCVASILVNPYGVLLPRTWLSIVESPTLTRIIDEHRPLALWSPGGALVVVLATAYLVLLVLAWKSRRVVWFLPAAWLVLAFVRVRHGPLFAVTAGLVIADMVPHTRLVGRAPEIGADRVPWSLRVAPYAIGGALVLSALALQVHGIRVPLVGQGAVRLDPGLWPTELLDVLRQHQGEGPRGTAIFNEYLYGGFIEYFAPGYRVFVDDRCELYRTPGDRYVDEWLNDYVRAASVETASSIRRWEERYGRFDLALVRTQDVSSQSGFDPYFRSTTEWETLARTATATLYRRRRSGE